MTDKQIIIDVTQCPYYKEDKICTYLPYKSKCEGDCNWTSYKEMEEQLKRSEAQCEAMFVSHTDLEKKYKAKEQECERLKEEIDDLKEIIQRHDNDNNALLSEIEDELCEYYRRHKECLAEIKEIAERGLNCSQCSCGAKADLDLILQKINKVENGLV